MAHPIMNCSSPLDSSRRSSPELGWNAGLQLIRDARIVVGPSSIQLLLRLGHGLSVFAAWRKFEMLGLGTISTENAKFEFTAANS